MDFEQATYIPANFPALTEAQLAAVQEMLSRVPVTTVRERRNVLRFLRARKYDVAGAEQQWKAFLQWRKERNVDEFVKTVDPFEQMWRNWSVHVHHKYDKLGRPVFYERSGEINSNINRLVKCVGEEHVYYKHVRHMEAMESLMDELSEKTGTCVQQQLIVMDLRNLSMRPNKTSMQLFRTVTNIDQTYYPERLAHIFLINAPRFFPALWAMVKPWLDPVTVSKFHVLGSDYQATLLEHISADSLPIEFGGECACAGGCVPPTNNAYVVDPSTPLTPWSTLSTAGSEGSEAGGSPVAEGECQQCEQCDAP